MARTTALRGLPPKAAEMMTLASITTLTINFLPGSIKRFQGFLLRYPCFGENPSNLKEDHLCSPLPNGHNPSDRLLSLQNDDFTPLVQIFHRILFELSDTDEFH